jgi:TolB-like protein/Tfp pilus assembly protein PilF
VPALHLPGAITTAIVVLVLLGFPIALVLAWAFELTPEGIKRSDEVAPAESIAPRTGRKLMITIAVVGVLALGLLLFQLTRPKSVVTAADSAAPATVAAPPAEAIPSKSIAVLPFQNLSKDEENAFFADGVQDEILTTLAKVADLKVISRTSVMQYKNTEKRNLPEIAQALKVAHVLEGSVQRAAGRVRVSAQLIDARTDAHLWAERYDRELADVFAIQSEIAQKIAQQLQAALSPKEKEAIAAKPTADLAAYDLYLRAKEITRQPVPPADRIHEAARLLEDAVKRDPAFVPALCLLVRAHLGLVWFAFDETPQRLELAKRALDAAARLEPDAGEVHLARAFFHYWGKREYDAALAELALARRALPNDADVAFLTGSLQRRQGRWEEATGHIQAAAALDPRNSIYQIECAGIYRQQRRYTEAVQVLDRALAGAPNDFPLARARAGLDATMRADLRRLQEVAGGDAIKSANPDEAAEFRMQLALAQRDYRAAQEALAGDRRKEMTGGAGHVVPREWLEGLITLGLRNPEQARASFLAARERAAARVAARPEDGVALVVLAQIDARLGRKEEALREVERALELHAAAGDELQRSASTNRFAAIYAQVGEIDRALDLLEQAAKRPNGPGYGALKLNEEWDPLRSHPRFEKILASLAPKDAPPPPAK